MGNCHTVGPNEALVVSGGCCGSDEKQYVYGGWAWAWWCVSDTQSHLNYFSSNLGAMSEEQGERFHQDIKAMEHEGRWNTNMMADYCWCLQHDNPDHDYSRASKKRKFVPYN